MNDVTAGRGLGRVLGHPVSTEMRKGLDGTRKPGGYAAQLCARITEKRKEAKNAKST